MSKKTEEFNMATFLEAEKNKIENIGFLGKAHESGLRNMIMRNSKKEFIRHYYLANIIPNGEHFILDWQKRLFPETDEELEKLFNPE